MDELLYLPAPKPEDKPEVETIPAQAPSPQLGLTVSFNKDDPDEVMELGDAFPMDACQVVRREFFAHRYDPSISFYDCKFTANTACLKKFPDTDYVQIMVNRDLRLLALRPCTESEGDAYPWCTPKRKPRTVSCPIFFAMITEMMGWDPKHRYKILGRLAHANGQYLLAFHLTATEIYQRISASGEKPRLARNPVFPADWQNQFGLPFSEHQKTMQLNIFDGFAFYSISNPDATPVQPADQSEKTASDHGVPSVNV